MSQFRLDTPSRSLGLCAAFATALTLALAVVVPTRLAPAAEDTRALASATPVEIVPGCIEVIAVRPQAAAANAVDARRAPGRDG
jgi:hypothetical protein